MKRHSWGERNPAPYKTERVCEDCDLVKITDKQDGHRPFPLIRWFHAEIGDFNSDHTPLCPPAELSSIAAA